MKNKIKFFFTIIFLSIVTVPVGTITHEFGHYFFAKIIGEEPVIKYNMTEIPKYSIISEKVSNEVNSKLNCANKKLLENASFEWYSIGTLLSKETNKEYMNFLNGLKIIAIGGPFVTILLGSFGFLFLLFRCRGKSIVFDYLNIFLVFTSLFWLREIFGFIQVVFSMNIHQTYTDELIIARLYKLPLLSLISFLALIGFFVFSIVIYKIENNLRKVFVTALFLGSFTGYLIWFYILGPSLMP